MMPPSQQAGLGLGLGPQRPAAVGGALSVLEVPQRRHAQEDGVEILLRSRHSSAYTYGSHEYVSWADWQGTSEAQIGGS